MSGVCTPNDTWSSEIHYLRKIIWDLQYNLHSSMYITWIYKIWIRNEKLTFIYLKLNKSFMYKWKGWIYLVKADGDIMVKSILKCLSCKAEQSPKSLPFNSMVMKNEENKWNTKILFKKEALYQINNMSDLIVHWLLVENANSSEGSHFS